MRSYGSYEDHAGHVGKGKNFTEDAEKCNADMDLISGRSYVDARSILGVCSLVRNRPLTLKIYADYPEFLSVKKRMEKYQVE